MGPAPWPRAHEKARLLEEAGLGSAINTCHKHWCKALDTSRGSPFGGCSGISGLPLEGGVTAWCLFPADRVAQSRARR